MNEKVYEVTDDSGFLALVDPKAYDAFVAEDWALEQMLNHFKTHMAARRLLIWGTGMENIWHVRVEQRRSDISGFREVSGPIVATTGRLLLTNYESLTTVAQYRDISLPEPYQRDLMLEIPSGEYLCRIVQLEDPNDYEARPEQDADFLLELIEHNGPSDPWGEIPWADV